MASLRQLSKPNQDRKLFREGSHQKNFFFLVETVIEQQLSFQQKKSPVFIYSGEICFYKRATSAEYPLTTVNTTQT